jgi:hypothetical protein
MSSAEAEEVAIEMDALNGVLGPDFVALECATVFVVGTGAHSGATEDEMRTVRAAVTDAVESNKRVSVFATTPHKHTQILNKAPDTVVAAIENVIQESSCLTFDRLTHRPARDGGLYGWGVIRPKAHLAALTYRIERHLAALLVMPSGNDGHPPWVVRRSLPQPRGSGGPSRLPTWRRPLLLRRL